MVSYSTMRGSDTIVSFVSLVLYVLDEKDEDSQPVSRTATVDSSSHNRFAFININPALCRAQLLTAPAPIDSGFYIKEAWPVYATSLIEVVRITLNAEMDTSPRYIHARTAIPTLHSHRNFSRSYQQVEHNASLLTIYGLPTLRKPNAKIRHFFQM